VAGVEVERGVGAKAEAVPMAARRKIIVATFMVVMIINNQKRKKPRTIAEVKYGIKVQTRGF